MTEGPEEIEAIRTKYEASVRFCDRQLGRVLDLMDELDPVSYTHLILDVLSSILATQMPCRSCRSGA